MITKQYKGFIELIPENGMVLKNKLTGEVSESISLGLTDSKENYIEIMKEKEMININSN